MTTDNPNFPLIKPADSDTPAAGICGFDEGEIVQIKLGRGSDGLPLGGRCIKVTALQRIELTNPTSGPIHVVFGMFDVDVPAGGGVLLDKPLGNYLAHGVHFLPNGPELWLVDLIPEPNVTIHPPIHEYLNSELGYSIGYTEDWVIDDSGMTSCVCKEVVFYPSAPESYVVYLSISINTLTLEELEKAYTEFFPDARKTTVIFAGEQAFQYLLPTGRLEIMLSHQDRTFRIFTDRPDNAQVMAVLASFNFIR